MSMRIITRSRKCIISLAGIMFFVAAAIFGPIIYNVDPTEFVGAQWEVPSSKFLFGTDAFGYDVLARTIFGMRTSLWIGATAAILTMSIAIVIGSIAAYKGGIIDHVLTLVTNVALIIPSLLMAMLIAAFVEERSQLMIAVMLAITSWPGVSRSVRAQILSLRNRDYVEIARMSGMSDLKMLFTEILPNMLSYIAINFASMLVGMMLAESGLAFLGLGTTKTISLGMVLFWANRFDAVRLGRWWMWVPAGLSLTCMAFFFISLSIGMDEIFNPRLRRK